MAVIEISLGEWVRWPHLIIAYHRRGGRAVYGGKDAGLVKQGIEPLMCIPVSPEEAELWMQDVPGDQYRVVAR